MRSKIIEDVRVCLSTLSFCRLRKLLLIGCDLADILVEEDDFSALEIIDLASNKICKVCWREVFPIFTCLRFENVLLDLRLSCNCVHSIRFCVIVGFDSKEQISKYCIDGKRKTNKYIVC